MELKVMGLPSILFFKGGEEVDRLSGNVDVSVIEGKITGLV